MIQNSRTQINNWMYFTELLDKFIAAQNSTIFLFKLLQIKIKFL